MKLKLDFLEPVGDVFVVDAFYENTPLVRMVGWNVGGFFGWVEGLGFAAKDYGLLDVGWGGGGSGGGFDGIPKGRKTETP